RPRLGRTPDQVGRELVRLRHLIDLLELEFAATAAEFAASEAYELEGAGSPSEWIHVGDRGQPGGGRGRAGGAPAAEHPGAARGAPRLRPPGPAGGHRGG